MSILTESWMDPWVVTQLNIPVMHLLIWFNRKIGMNGSWLQYPEMARKIKQPNKMNMEGK